MAITNGYCTLQDLKDRLNISATDDDSMLESVIEGVSRAIDRYTNSFFYDDQSATYYYTAEYSDILVVDPLQSVTTLKTDSDGDRTYEETWTASDYDLMPFTASNRSESYHWIELTPEGDYTFPTGITKGVEIVGNFGWASIPKPINEACLLQSERIFKRKDAPFGIAGAPRSDTIRLIPEMDPDVLWMLAPYRRIIDGSY